MSRPSTSVVLAAGTVDGSGTTVALTGALLHLSHVAQSGRQVTAVVPEHRVGMYGDHEVVMRPTSRWRALLDEALGRPMADVYVGFADRLPLRPGLSNTELVMVVQNPHLYGPASEWAEGNRIKHAVLSRWARLSARRADLVICSTEASRADVIADASVDPSHVVVRPIPPRPLDLIKGDHRATIARVLTVSDLYSYKRVDVALDAVTRFAQRQQLELEFVHVGRSVESGAEHAFADAVARAEAAGVVVTRLGEVAHERVFEEMVAADVQMLPSTTESQGVPLAEAMSVGLPTICRRIDVFTEQGGDAIVAVDAASDRTAEVSAFADALASVAPLEVRHRMGRSGRQAQPDRPIAEPFRGWDLLPGER